MCGRIVREDGHGFGDAFGLAEFSETRIQPRFNVAPTQLDLMIHGGPDGRRLVDSRWGLIPSWAKERSIGAKMFNARAETLTERPAFRNLVARRRCIVPVSGFYEWRREGKAKTPIYIHGAGGAPLALAGLWSEWRDPASGEQVTSHTVITCAPNDLMAAIHDRMPVVLDRDALDLWLDPETTNAADVLPVLGPCPSDMLDAYPVRPLVNNVRNDGPDLIEPTVR